KPSLEEQGSEQNTDIENKNKGMPSSKMMDIRRAKGKRLEEANQHGKEKQCHSKKSLAKSSAALAQPLNLRPTWSDGSGFHGTQMGFAAMSRRFQICTKLGLYLPYWRK
ncbi:hypothetical protein Tco_1296933, partial [Tanacetum coccineum]